MKTVEKTGKNLEDALDLALEELGCDIDQVDYEIVENDSKGFLGIFGAKEAKIRVTKKFSIVDEINDFISKILFSLGIDLNIEINREGEVIKVNLEGENISRVIGKNGATLDALQYLTNIIVNKGQKEYTRIILDANGYKKRKIESLEGLAKAMADKAVRLRKDIVLRPMSSYERKIIHFTLQKDDRVRTKSDGIDPYRKVIIFLNR
ncbi:MAG: protein jag [Clostridiales bacterium]|nr:MAG: protein jag [Clostridiales bacterium]